MANESISIPNFLVNQIKQSNPDNSLRGNTIQIIVKYFEILKVGRREVRKTFTDNELMFLADICNGTMFEPFSIILENNGILMQYDDTIDIYGGDYLEKWQVEDFRSKLENLSKLAQIALIDIIEVFWNEPGAEIGGIFKKKAE